MKPSIEIMAGLYGAALEQQARAQRAIERTCEAIGRHGYTVQQVEEFIKHQQAAKAADYAMTGRRAA